MEKEASIIHSETLHHIDDSEDVQGQADRDDVLLEELLQKEEEEVMALLASLDETNTEDVEMEDLGMVDSEMKEGS